MLRGPYTVNFQPFFHRFYRERKRESADGLHVMTFFLIFLIFADKQDLLVDWKTDSDIDFIQFFHSIFLQSKNRPLVLQQYQLAVTGCVGTKEQVKLISVLNNMQKSNHIMLSHSIILHTRDQITWDNCGTPSHCQCFLVARSPPFLLSLQFFLESSFSKPTFKKTCSYNLPNLI